MLHLERGKCCDIIWKIKQNRMRITEYVPKKQKRLLSEPSASHTVSSQMR